MVNIVIAGLPKNVKIPKFINYLEKAVFRDVVDVRILHTMHVDGNVKNITLSMRSNDARRARRFLNGLPYHYAGKEYPLECWQNDTENSRRDRDDMGYPDSPTEKHFSNNVEPSENPSSLRRELEEIDLKIEIVKRQRILLEEENKLLVEQKKTEMLHKIGPNDYENLVKFEKVCGLKNQNEIAKLSPPSTTSAKKKNSNKLPSFNAPCKIIIKEMNQVLSDHVKPENRDMIMSLIYSAIRKRLILVLQGKSFMPAPDIVHLYRLKYPQNTDMKLLEELMDTVSQSFWPKKDPNDNEGSQVKTKNEETDEVIIKKDENEDAGNNDDVQIITENDVEIVKVDLNEQNNDEKVETKQEPENNKSEVETSVNEKTISSIENVDEIVDVDNENNKSEVETSVNEKTISSIENVDEVVDVDNDFDEWVENDSKEEKEVENKELEL